MIIGDSIIRHVQWKASVNICIPGANVNHITAEIRGALEARPSVNTVVVHVGTNDTKRQQSEVLKQDFLGLFKILKLSEVKSYISGSIPTLGRGMGRFSRLLSLHTWLSRTCPEHGLIFIDNFNLLWQRRDSFKYDGLHLNYRGSRLLSSNIFFYASQQKDNQHAASSLAQICHRRHLQPRQLPPHMTD